ncbi:hypothetical protein ATANTOWER_018140 [Ataeniobius toweri]|uniref:Uncharacterized protein n=1 Tax=Ataeniobius toweri TaxID=208326 RepID=A0ABU7AFV8_9TELE|nr:hypothetical protein [Ataeniobius toweri]
MLMWISLDLKPPEPPTWKTYHCCNQPRLWSTQVPYMSCLDNNPHELALDVLCMQKSLLRSVLHYPASEGKLSQLFEE